MTSERGDYVLVDIRVNGEQRITRLSVDGTRSAVEAFDQIRAELVAIENVQAGDGVA